MSKKRSFMNIDVTLADAVKRFSALDPLQAADKSETFYNEREGAFAVPFIGKQYRVVFPSGQVFSPDGEGASPYFTVLILHYLVTADGTPLTGRWIAYRHLPGGDIYIEPFQKRAVTPFLQTFGDRPEVFEQAAVALGGYRIATSGIGMAIPILPRVPIGFTIWPGDEELPASANILFDEAAPSYLPTEDYAHLPAIVNGALKGQL